MNIPELQGNLSHSNFFIYAAADPVYFDSYARPLIKSIQANAPNYGCHIHIYNPRPDQLEFCQRHSVSHTWEQVTGFDQVAQKWLTRSVFNNERQRQMYSKGQTMGIAQLRQLVANTYYACMRFVRLAQILPQGQKCLSLDVDGLVRRKFSHELGNCDFYLYEKPKDHSHLAGAILFNGTNGSTDFLNQYATELRNSIDADDLYWFLDQVVLDHIVPQYKKGLLPMSYIDWSMADSSAIWSAKGKRKDLAVFVNELKKYNS